MSNTLLLIAGCLGMAVSVVHGYLGQRQVVAPIEGVGTSAKRIMAAIMFLSALYWFVAGAALIASHYLLPAEGQFLVALIAAAIYLSGALANFWATRGRHFGWAALLFIVVMIGFGA